jgi:hypothetical protein
MAKEKVTITLDRTKADRARDLVAARSVSDVIDVALDRLIDAERLRRDIAAYRRLPPGQTEKAISLLGYTGGLGDQTDWEALYPEPEDDR